MQNFASSVLTVVNRALVSFRALWAGERRGESDLNAAFDLLHLVHVECLGCRAVDYGSGEDVEPRAVALAHDRRPREQPPESGHASLALLQRSSKA
jgi:hypothetical protein